jgi:nucleoside-diphosphate-sugar epimerase
MTTTKVDMPTILSPNTQWSTGEPGSLAGFDKLKGCSCLVVGATGFIGRVFVERMLDLGFSGVAVFARGAKRTLDWRRRGVEVIVGDLADAEAVTDAVRGRDLVINLAHDFAVDRATNERNFENLVDAVVDAEPQRFLHVSSVVVYKGWPNEDITEDLPLCRDKNDYIGTKIAAERSIAARMSQSKTVSVILQPTIVYGAGSWLWTDVIVEKMLAGKIAVSAGGHGMCNAVHVNDIVQGILLAAIRPVPVGAKFILSGPEPVSWRQFLGAYEAMIGKPSIVYIDSGNDPQFREAGTASGGAARETQARPANVFTVLRRELDRRLSTRFKIRTKAALLSLTQRTTQPVFYPGPGEAELHAARGRCLIGKARSELGYNPEFDLAKGMAMTEEYIRAKYLTRVTR